MQKKRAALVENGYLCCPWNSAIRTRLQTLPRNFLDETFNPKRLRDELVAKGTRNAEQREDSGSSTSHRRFSASFYKDSWSKIQLNKKTTQNQEGTAPNTRTEMMKFGASSKKPTQKRPDTNHTPFEKAIAHVLQIAIATVEPDHHYSTKTPVHKPRKKQRDRRKKRAKKEASHDEISNIAPTHVVSAAHLHTPLSSTQIPDMLTPDINAIKSLNVVEYWSGQSYTNDEQGRCREREDWVKLQGLHRLFGAQHHHRDFDQSCCRQGKTFAMVGESFLKFGLDCAFSHVCISFFFSRSSGPFRVQYHYFL